MTKRRVLWLAAVLFLAYGLWLLIWALSFGAGVSARSVGAETLRAGGDGERTAPASELLPGDRIDLNSASAEELQRLPGIGETLAAAIEADREANGPFSSPEDLMRVSGIGQKRFDAVRELVTAGDPAEAAPGE